MAFADKTANPDRCLYTLFSSLASIGLFHYQKIFTAAQTDAQNVPVDDDSPIRKMAVLLM